MSKNARRCGTKHISKSNVRKTAGFQTILKCQFTNGTNISPSTNNNYYNYYNNDNNYNKYNNYNYNYNNYYYYYN